MLPAEERGCSYRLWTHEDGRNIKPPCGLAYNYPGVLLTEEPGADTTKMTTVMLSIRGAATPAAKKLNTIVMSQGRGVDERHHRVDGRQAQWPGWGILRSRG
jgi:hypothetical protein